MIWTSRWKPTIPAAASLLAGLLPTSAELMSASLSACGRLVWPQSRSNLMRRARRTPGLDTGGSQDAALACGPGAALVRAQNRLPGRACDDNRHDPVEREHPGSRRRRDSHRVELGCARRELVDGQPPADHGVFGGIGPAVGVVSGSVNGPDARRWGADRAAAEQRQSSSFQGGPGAKVAVRASRAAGV